MEGIFNKSKNTVLYVHLIRKARCAARRKAQGNYYERHHIIPKSIGGSNDKTNLILLTANEHIRAHLLLPEIVLDGTQKYKMECAVHYMTNTSEKLKRYGLQSYSTASKAFASSHSKAMSGKNNPMFGRTSAMRGKKHTVESKKKMSEWQIGEGNPGFKGYYQTPFGRFPSSFAASQAAQNQISQPSVYRICLKPDRTISRISYVKCPYLQRNYEMVDVVGRTWRELGFSFESGNAKIADLNG